MQRNPFTPTFGVVPPIMAGRQQLLADMHDAFETGIGNPNLSTLVIGARGTGKTALLSCVADEARQCGWLAVEVASSRGMLEDIVQRAAEAAAQFAGKGRSRHVTGIDIAQVLGVQWQLDAPVEPNWRTRMNAVFGALEAHATGLLITVDEANPSNDELVHLASTYQLFIREGKKVSLVMAGLPKQVSSLVSNDSVSFLRRARKHYLAGIGDADVESAFRATVESAGKEIDRPAIDLAVAAIRGFAYMMQLVGYFSWMESGTNAEISQRDVERGIELAVRDLENGVLDATYRELSAGDVAFLEAMLEDESESRLSSVARRLGKPNGYASSYKTRLARQGVIDELPGGALVISMPFFREYLESRLGR